MRQNHEIRGRRPRISFEKEEKRNHLYIDITTAFHLLLDAWSTFTLRLADNIAKNTIPSQ